MAAAAVRNHRTAYGNWCPGWAVPAHPATDLTADHKTPKQQGGTNTADNIQVLCRACNSRKHDRDGYDRPQVTGG
nr:HNH endonuclease signature motif containing protein [Streptomyces sp. SID5468]